MFTFTQTEKRISDALVIFATLAFVIALCIAPIAH